jgi:predicted HicB family RNase H-like nuclease
MTDKVIEKKALKKIIADIPAYVHAQVKAHAALQSISMQNYIIRALIEKLQRDIPQELHNENLKKL